MTHLVPSAALLRPVIHQDTMRPGHQEKPRSFPQTSSPMPKPRPSCSQRHRQIIQSGFTSELIPPQFGSTEERKRAGNFGTERSIHQRRRKNNTSHFTIHWNLFRKISEILAANHANRNIYAHLNAAATALMQDLFCLPPSPFPDF